MLPRVDLPEVILEVMSWAPELAEAFTAVSGGRSRLGNLPTSVAACLAAHAMNIGYRPVAKKGVPALERARLSHVFQNYVRPETLAAANAPLVARRAGLCSRGRGAAVWSPRSTGCGSWSRSRPRSPGPIEILRVQEGHDVAQRHQ
jgi:Tn3 transposase DDE domain